MHRTWISLFLLWLSTDAWAAHIYSQFAAGIGHWQARGARHIENHIATTAALNLGLDFGSNSPFVYLKADSTRLMNIAYQGTDPDNTRRRHEIEGLGLGLGWRGERYLGWAGFGGGRWRTKSDLGKLDRFSYRTPFVGIGARVYQSSIASILALYEVSQLKPEDSWYDEYGFKDPWQQTITFAIQLRSQD